MCGNSVAEIVGWESGEGHEDLSWLSEGESVVTGIRTNISGNVRASSSSSASPLPKFDSFTTINILPSKQEMLPVARLIALNTFCQFANTSATPTRQPISQHRGLWGVLSVPSARQFNFDSKLSICAARPADRSRNCERLSNSACFSAMREVRMCGGRKRAGGWDVDVECGVVGSSIEGREYGLFCRDDMLVNESWSRRG